MPFLLRIDFNEEQLVEVFKEEVDRFNEVDDGFTELDDCVTRSGDVSDEEEEVDSGASNAGSRTAGHPTRRSPIWCGVAAAGQALPPLLPPPGHQGAAAPSALRGDPMGVSNPSLPPRLPAAGAPVDSYLNLPGAYSPNLVSRLLKVLDAF